MEQRRSSPFRKGKFYYEGLACKVCKGFCCRAYPYFTLYAIDFEENNVDAGLEWLFANDLLYVKQLSYESGKEFYVPFFIQNYNCFFLEEDGCKLSSDERPIACGHMKTTTEKNFLRRKELNYPRTCAQLSSPWKRTTELEFERKCGNSGWDLSQVVLKELYEKLKV